MTAENLELRLPAGWRELAPAPGSLFLAVHEGEHAVFAPVLAVSATPVPEGGTLTAVAEEMFESAAGRQGDAVLLQRGEEEDGYVLQALEMTLNHGGQDVRLGEFQAIVALDEATAGRRGALAFTLAAARDEIEHYVDDFQAFLDSAQTVEPE